MQKSILVLLEEEAPSIALEAEVKHYKGELAWLHATVPPIIHGDVKIFVNIIIADMCIYICICICTCTTGLL